MPSKLSDDPLTMADLLVKSPIEALFVIFFLVLCLFFSSLLVIEMGSHNYGSSSSSDLSKDCGLFVRIDDEDIKFYKEKLMESHEKNKVLEKDNKDLHRKNIELEKENNDMYNRNIDLEDKLMKANMESLKKNKLTDLVNIKIILFGVVVFVIFNSMY
ncbi:hypothetical protein L2E82_46896 [Cichorium intybus]|uniref:Uncharacterized protein n=1 Tax=Cichorium intybus TaxID=13427 RepID=A0ACB8YV46_CICIN|nr:hypothetical protein L2E82_46896 [Cichorium intybus]